MTEITLTPTRLRAGVWEGILTGTEEPALEVSHLGVALSEVTLTPVEGGHAVRVALPASLLDEGVQTVLFRDTATGETLGHVTIVAGAPLEADIRGEVDLLRAELDMLKRAFRRHCLETGA